MCQILVEPFGKPHSWFFPQFTRNCTHRHFQLSKIFVDALDLPLSQLFRHPSMHTFQVIGRPSKRHTGRPGLPSIIVRTSVFAFKGRICYSDQVMHKVNKTEAFTDSVIRHMSRLNIPTTMTVLLLHTTQPCTKLEGPKQLRPCDPNCRHF